MKNLTPLDPTTVFTLAPDARTRGNGYKLIPPKQRLVKFSNSLPVRVVSVWNDLPSHAIELDTPSAFRNFVAINVP